MKTFLLNTYLVTIFSIVMSCKEAGRFDMELSDAPAPALISYVEVIPTPGGGKITYTLPKDPNLLYVKAVYDIGDGISRETKASLYIDTLSLEGFGNTDEYRIALYSVGKNKRESEPTYVTLTPQKPPVQTVFESMALGATFGGARVDYTNEHRAKLAIYVLVDSLNNGKWEPAKTFYTSSAGGQLSVRGYEPKETRFAVYVKDRWNNMSDTLFENFTPIKEEFIQKPWVRLELSGDTYVSAEPSYYSLERLWNGVYNTGYEGFASSNSSTLPQHFTFDFGRTVLINRFKVYHFSVGALYAAGAPKRFEIWGSNSPDTDGGWDNWVRLGTFDSYKPSGLPLNNNSEEDRLYAAVNGEDFDFTVLPSPVRYIRFRTLETYGTSGQVSFSELSFWGQMLN